MNSNLLRFYGHDYLRIAAHIIVRASNDIKGRDFARALSRFEGALQYNPTNQLLHYFAGKLYFEIGDKVSAGKHFYLLQNTCDYELKCVALFEKSLGNDPSLILRKIYKRGIKLNTLDDYARERIKVLIISIVEQYPLVPKFASGIRRYFDNL